MHEYNGGPSKGYGFVFFQEEADAAHAVKSARAMLDPKTGSTKLIQVRYAASQANERFVETEGLNVQEQAARHLSPTQSVEPTVNQSAMLSHVSQDGYSVGINCPQVLNYSQNAIQLISLNSPLNVLSPRNQLMPPCTLLLVMQSPVSPFPVLPVHGYSRVALPVAVPSLQPCFH